MMTGRCKIIKAYFYKGYTYETIIHIRDNYFCLSFYCQSSSSSFLPPGSESSLTLVDSRQWQGQYKRYLATRERETRKSEWAWRSCIIKSRIHLCVGASSTQSTPSKVSKKPSASEEWFGRWTFTAEGADEIREVRRGSKKLQLAIKCRESSVLDPPHSLQ